MRGWGIGINWVHVAVWRRGLAMYAGFVLFCLIAGANLGPRPDEILFAVMLPAWAIIPYAIASLLVAVLRLWLVRWEWQRRLIGALVANLRLGG